MQPPRSGRLLAFTMRMGDFKLLIRLRRHDKYPEKYEFEICGYTLLAGLAAAFQLMEQSGPGDK
jgi:hypothetical protein